MRYSENEMNVMPLDELEEAIQNMEVPDLTFALEIFGQRCSDSTRVQKVVSPYLDHPNAVVREGAIYGLYDHHNKNILSKFLDMLATDPSKCIKEILLGMFK